MKNFALHKTLGVYECPEGFNDIRDTCYLLSFDTLFKKIRMVLEIVLVIWSIIYLLIAVRESTFLPTDIFMQNMALCPSRVGYVGNRD